LKKRLFVFALIALIAAGTVSAWEPNDLTEYPSCMEDGSWILNFGVGLPYFDHWHNAYFPPMRLTVDRNTSFGGLPFFIGGIVGYSGYGRRNDWFAHNIPIGGRFGYHFNWGIDNFDTYAVTTLGTRVSFITGPGWRNHHLDFYDWFLFGVNIGARYFVSDFFGFWAEIGWTTFSALDIGISFKF